MKARDIKPGDVIYIGEAEAERATDELYKACWGKAVPKSKVAFYTIIPSDNSDGFELEWYLIPKTETVGES